MRFCFFTYSRTCSRKLSKYSQTKLYIPVNILPMMEKGKKDRITHHLFYMTNTNNLI